MCPAECCPVDTQAAEHKAAVQPRGRSGESWLPQPLLWCRAASILKRKRTRSYAGPVEPGAGQASVSAVISHIWV